jgi:arsenate reductase (thioredoxin)
MEQAVKHVLFICTGNSARGLMAEALMTVKGNGLFRGFSAGVHPGGLINPFAAELIQQCGYPMERLRCKRWEEFSGANAIPVDFIISLCEHTGNFPQPAWPGNPIIAAWNIEDPTSTTGSIEEKRRVFKRVCRQIEEHIELFLLLPHNSFDREVLRQELNDFHLLCNSGQVANTDYQSKQIDGRKDLVVQ